MLTVPISQAFSLERLTALWALKRPGVVWRHDVDHDLACAVQMATWEREFGIKATYYLRTEAPEYDCQGEQFGQAAERILAAGHRLGTHVELGLRRETVIKETLLVAACEFQSAKLADWPVGNRVSLHRPPADVLWRKIPGFDHALAPHWRGRYVSDSRNRFRSSPEEALRSTAPVQVNLHPCWWFLPAEEARLLRERHEAVA